MERIILDVDTGHDDAIAICFAAANPEIKLEGLVACTGNTSRENAINNTLNMSQLLGITAPVYAGCVGPLVRKPVPASPIHGPNGLEGPVFGPRTKQVEKANATEFIIKTVMENPGQISFVSIGPWTDLAIAMKVEPKLAKNLKQVVLMGGSSKMGNVTPCAEFNVFADAEAAQIVLHSEAPTYVMSLDVTLKLIFDDEKLKDIKKVGGGKTLEVFLSSMECYRQRVIEYVHDYPAMHDPTTIAYLINPSLFKFKKVPVEVELQSGLSYGRTHLMFPGGETNVHWATDVDEEGFWKIMNKTYEVLSDR